MYLKNVFVRFYKSFNFDYLRKYDQKVQDRHDWEKLDDLWYPYVRIPIDEKITTVVGANESGKTHLLTAIEKGLSGEDITRGDFCRYSQFFAVEQGKMRWPDFGFDWAGLTQTESDAIASVCEGLTRGFDRFLMFRTENTKVTVYVQTPQGYTAHPVSNPSALLPMLPSVFRLQENVALPESVPILFLADEARASGGLEALPRHQRVGLLESIWSHLAWFQTKQTVTQSADAIVSEMGRLTGPAGTVSEVTELNLARDLIRKVARIDPEALKELYGALREGRDAFANSIIDKINDELQARLNFPNWWVQDRKFRILVSPREFDLVFTIRDRTETEYSFRERSSGLRYFLSYYIQYLAHEHRTDRRELLLMDEPDAFLSNQGQQDLLKIFDAFANPGDGSIPIQLIYVTHSPFLIDKNHGERIRVLEKGLGEEGTRVVRDASRNHYEPLRSAFGSFVGETTFIGNCNLMVEGTADQILLAGAATYLRGAGAPEVETLDLNHITIVPAGSASHIPYLVYLARGRDVDRPAVIVMMDSDSAGNAAKKELLRGGPRRQQLIKPCYILQIGELSSDPLVRGPLGKPLVETEDLVPLPICAQAVQRYMREVCAVEASTVERVTADAIGAEAAEGNGIFKSIEVCLHKINEELHIEKIGFARAVIEIVVDLSVRAKDDTTAAPALREFETNMKTLFRRWRQMQREVDRELTSELVSARVNRAKSSFLQDHSVSAKREHVFVLFEEIESALDNSAEADEIRLQIQSLRRDFKIDDNLTEPVEGYTTFRERLESLRYAGRLATQEATLQEAAIVAAKPDITR
jgi:predicted ATPase